MASRQGMVSRQGMASRQGMVSLQGMASHLDIKDSTLEDLKIRICSVLAKIKH